jgi:NADP-dependent 3-hydroxy acid dehydrogenase YdfG/enamine deaminase RidA (YjgF/YER057c/UK114 family)
VAALVQAGVAAFGGIHVLVNNVGGGGGGARIADSTDDDWRGAIERNLIQTVRMMRLALPHMKGRTGASVINVASISGWSPQLAMSGQYGAAKAALIFDTERWALEFVPHGIRVNTVSPGSILVLGNGWDRYRLANQEYFDDYVRHGFPMGRLGTAEEVADVIAFLASPRAHWINGETSRSMGWNNPTRPWTVGRFSGFHRDPVGGVVGSAEEGHKFGDDHAPHRRTLIFSARTSYSGEIVGPMREILPVPSPGLDLRHHYGHHQSPAIRAGGLIFCSGMVAVNPETGEREHGTLTSEARRIFENLKLLLESAGSSLDRLVQVHAMIYARIEYDVLNRLYRQYVPNAPPARTVMSVQIEAGFKVMLDVIAAA